MSSEVSGYNPDKVPPEIARAELMTVGEALKLAKLTKRDACDTTYRETELQIRDADTVRQATEDKRSIHRNKNRAYVLVVGLTISLIWPMVAVHLFNSQFLANFASALGYCGNLGVTFYALMKRY